MKITILSAILFVALMPIDLSAQVLDGRICISDGDTLYSLTGRWKYMAGDDPAWAGPAFDDSRWEMKKFPSWIRPASGTDKPGFLWYRMRFSVPDSIINAGPLFLSLPRGYRSYEAYVNGTKIISLGKLPGPGQGWEWAVGGSYAIIPQHLLRYGAEQVLAIRIYEGFTLLDSIFYDYGFIGAYNLKNNFILLSSVAFYLFSALAMVLGAYHLLRFRKSRMRSHLWFALYCVLFGLSLFSSWTHDLLSSGDPQLFLAITFSLILGSALMATLFFRDFFRPAGEIDRMTLVPGIATLAIIIAMLLTRDLHLLEISLYTMIVLSFAATIAMPLFLYRRISSGESELMPMLYGFLIAIAGIILDILKITGIDVVPRPNFLWQVFPFTYVIAAFLISITIGKKEARDIKIIKKRIRPAAVNRPAMPAEDDLGCRLNAFMEQEKLYRDESISTISLAARLGVHPRKLSVYLNDIYKVNFYTYINTYRIEEAKALLLNEPESSVLSIAYQVGFNSASKFYSAFKKITGKKPQAYRKNGCR